MSSSSSLPEQNADQTSSEIIHDMIDYLYASLPGYSNDLMLLTCSYVDQMLAEYNVQCEAGKQAFLTFHSLDLEPHNCYDGRQMR